jgi:uncharacterized membrane protein YgcG
VTRVLDPVKRWRHVMVAVAAMVVPVLIAFGVMGRGARPEQFDAKLVVVTPVGEGVHLHEVVDIDFGRQQRHGYQRVIPNDFGTPADVTASSPNASSQIDVTQEGTDTRIRLGDPNETISGRHRYVLDYTLPDAHLGQHSLALDVIGDQETLATRRFVVILSGFRLSDLACNVGAAGTSGGCSLAPYRDGYRAEISPLRAGQGLTVGGTITGITARVHLTDPSPLPEPITKRRPLMVTSLVVGLGVALLTFLFSVRAGRNEVGGTDAADAAFATATSTGSTRLVSDRELEALATTEFEPPRGIRPWHGALLLREKLDNETVSAWFSDQIAQQVVVLTGEGDDAVLSAGPLLHQAPPITKQRIETLVGSEGQLQLGSYQPRLATLWKDIQAEQKVAAKESGWWRRGAPGSGLGAMRAAALPVLIALLVIFNGVFGALRDHAALALVSAFVLPGAAGFTAYSSLLPSRSVAGSALAVRTESFRRFLEASEGKHVDWAWEHGLLRDYSAWAVALGAAEAWGRAVAASAVSPPEISVNTMPMFMYTSSSMWHSTFTAPHQSSSGGGGGFSSGFSGGGGGGGSSGSW